MWILEGLQRSGNPERVCYIHCGEPLKIGRVQGNHIILLDDRSVSREHATLLAIHDDKNLYSEDCIPEIVVQDLASKYGTYVNEGITKNQKIPAHSPQPLEHGDKIRFGALNNIFCLRYKPLVVTSSQLTTKEQLKQDLLVLGGHLVRDWTRKCTLLAMNELRLTAKTVCALASGSNIVTTKYFSDFVSAVRSKSSPPDPAACLPLLKEPSLNSSQVSFAPDPLRSSLFHGKTFVFQKKNSLKKLKVVISLAGGQSVELTDSNSHQVLEDNHIFIKSSEKEEASPPPFVAKAVSLMKQKGLNPIPESDIGLAILYKNTENYCNPRFNVNNILKPLQHSQRPESNPLLVYATETQNDSEVSKSPLKSIELFLQPSCTTIVESRESVKNNRQNQPLGVAGANRARAESLAANRVPSLCTESSTYCTANKSVCDSGYLEEKENAQKIKRETTGFSKPSPQNRCNRIVTNEPEKLPVMLENTEPMPADEDASLHSLNTFEPLHFSTERTERESSVRKRNRNPVTINDKGITDKTAGKSNMRVAPTELSPVKRSPSIPAIEERTVASLPYYPYTLPSLVLDDIPSIAVQVENTKMAAVKEEPAGQSQVEENTEPFLGSNSWKGKREVREEMLQDKKRQRISHSPAKNPSTSKSHHEDVTNKFALPCPSGPRRRRARGSSCDNTDGGEKPESKRCRTTDHSEAVIKQECEPVHNTLIKRCVSDVQMECSKNDMECSKNDQPVSSTEPLPFLSKGDCSIMPKQEPNQSADVSKLEETLQKSLVVVEVVSLVRTSCQLRSGTAAAPSTSTGLPNFKKFKKVYKYTHESGFSRGQAASEMSSLPRIIGGRDLIFHAEVNNRRTDFLSSQVADDSSEEDSEKQRNGVGSNEIDSDEIDSAFTLTANCSRRRRRIR